MKMTTNLQREIIELRETLATFYTGVIDGTACVDGVDIKRTPEIERLLQDCMTSLIVRTSELRARQQETFDQCPTLAASCVRV